MLISVCFVPSQVLFRVVSKKREADYLTRRSYFIFTSEICDKMMAFPLFNLCYLER